MNALIRILPLAVTLLALAGAPAGARAGIKCWTNDQGVRECGNVVPPEYAQQGHERVSEQGIVIERKEAAKTPEELAEEARLAAEKAERERLAAEQARRDRVLLDTFTTEDDLILARDGKLRAIDSRIEHTAQVQEKLEARLRQLRKEAASQERSGQKVSDEVLEQIAEVKRQIRDNEAFIEARNAEKRQLQAQFEADLERYRELKGMN